VQFSGFVFNCSATVLVDHPVDALTLALFVPLGVSHPAASLHQFSLCTASIACLLLDCVGDCVPDLVVNVACGFMLD
jgi:hypothetical protein